ncbi:peptidoglycan -binding protein [Hyphomicrobium methylovorum]|uniref:peptidoglycan -binding protein n=1 Tax=Hyphomicrobium methylovorum TaxID=84 RepID=UPI0015E65938|nr:peptidoglycan -binding protein [Hyphomicrobium methylovorum]MBA2127044.1 peptidoglycan -binding protein [Hyphomicrobium methylovorum]
MARGRSRRSGEYGEFWPAYVDVLSTLLLVVTLLMSIFMIAQYFSAEEATGKDSALKRLTRQISELTSMLSLEKGKSQSAADELAALQASLSALKADNQKLTGAGLGADERAEAAEGKIAGLSADLESQKNISSEALSKVDLLNQQLIALRRQIAALNDALDAADKKGDESDKTIKDLGARLNAALAIQVQELKRYRSDFFGRLSELLKDRKDIRVVGDRFVFESEVLFPSGSATLTPEGMSAMDKIAEAIVELQRSIPNDIDWALQINGHTDSRPISKAQFPSNWELSTARAAAVVKYLIVRGVPADRLVAAGYGEFQPVDGGTSEEAMQKNRRIELKLTSR